MRLRTWLVLSLLVLAVLLLVGRGVTALVVEQAWYAAMGVPGIFWEQLTDTVLLQGGAWLLGSCFAFANLHAVPDTIPDEAAVFCEPLAAALRIPEQLSLIHI